MRPVKQRLRDSALMTAGVAIALTLGYGVLLCLLAFITLEPAFAFETFGVAIRVNLSIGFVFGVLSFFSEDGV